MPPALQPYVPFVAFGALLFAMLVVWRAAWARGAKARPLLLVLIVLSAAPALYTILVWGRVIPESILRFGRPWATFAGLAAGWAVALRSLRQTRKQGRLRTTLADLV